MLRARAWRYNEGAVAYEIAPLSSWSPATRPAPISVMNLDPPELLRRYFDPPQPLKMLLSICARIGSGRARPIRIVVHRSKAANRAFTIGTRVSIPWNIVGLSAFSRCTSGRMILEPA